MMFPGTGGSESFWIHQRLDSGTLIPAGGHGGIRAAADAETDLALHELSYIKAGE